MAQISYARALNQALHQKIAADERVFLIGQGVTSPWYVGSTTVGLVDRFGPERIIDTPVSENGIAGAAVGAALAGMRPILLFPRMDFMFYAMDPIANHAANWHYMFGGQYSVPLVIWAVINRGGEQAAQHSQAIQSIFAHLPGLKVVMPSTPYDAKGLLLASIDDDNPVLFIDERWLYDEVGEVPEEMYGVQLGKGVVRCRGADVSIVAASYMALEAAKAARILADDGVAAEVIDLRSLGPLDEKLVLDSVRKTGRLVVADGGWKTCGISAELSALVAEKAFKHLKAPILRVALPDVPAPASSCLERVFYPGAKEIVAAARRVIGS